MKVPPGMCLVPEDAYPLGSGGETVRLPAFAMDRTPVTNGEYARFLEAVREPGAEEWDHPLQPRRKAHVPQYWYEPGWSAADAPVVGVDWWDAWAFASWAGKRLPSEEEWEAAAAGSGRRRYPWGETWDPARCNSRERWGADWWKEGRTTPVGAHPGGASPFGILDLAGNVWEWTRAAFLPGWAPGAERSFEGGGTIAIRGGSFRRTREDQRCVSRDESEADCRGPNNGFRCVLPLVGGAE